MGERVKSMGKVIKISNMPNGFRDLGKIDKEGSIHENPYWVYVCSPCFVCYVKTSQFCEAFMAIWRYNGTTWVQVDDKSIHIGSRGYFYHNCGTEHYTPDNGQWTKGDDGNQHLYRIGYRKQIIMSIGNSGSAEFHLLIGNSIASGCDQNNNARGTHKGDLIQRTGSNDFYWKSGVREAPSAHISTDDTAVAKWRSSNMKGKLITEADIPYIANCAY